jgi:hypothetical protein
VTVDQLRIPEDGKQLRDMIVTGGGTHNSPGTRRHLTAGGSEIFVAVEARAPLHDASQWCVRLRIPTNPAGDALLR